MAYSKQTWTDDVSAVTGARMTHIEQGIYDNSLATDKINPSGTATTSAEIEAGQITDVIGFKSLKLKGQTSQYTTTGKNLFPRITFSQTINGVTITATGDGTIKIKGTANSSGVNHPIWGAWGSSTTLFTIPAGTYTASGIGTRQASPRINIVTNGTTSIFVTNTTQTLDSDTNVTGIFIWVDAETTVDTTFKPMIETGSSATSYEPYTGKKASPNPDYPQDVNNVSGDNVIRISNKNLIEDETFVQGAFNDSTGTKRISCRNIKLKANTTYTLSSNLNYSTYNVAIVTSKKTFPISSGEQIYDSGWKTATFSFTTGTDDVYANIAVKKAGELAIVPSDVSAYHFQLEKGNTATSYIEYQGNDFEINLGSSNAIINKNLIQNETFVQGGAPDNTATTRISCRNIKLKANTTYTLSSTLDYNDFNINICTSGTAFPHAAPYTYDSGWKSENFSFTVGSSDVYANIAVRNSANTTAIVPSDIAGYHFQIEKGDTATAYEPNFTPIELCKISTYQDYIFKKDGKWWKHKAIDKLILNGSETWSIASTGTANWYYNATISSINIINDSTADNSKCTHYPFGSVGASNTNQGYYIVKNGKQVRIRYGTEDTVANFTTWLSTNTPSLYYVLAIPIEEEITYTPLIRQLDELYNSGLYDVTNISQDNSSETFILDLEACKNNINGIVEYIRR